MTQEQADPRTPQLDEVRSAHLVGIGGTAMMPLAIGAWTGYA